MAILKQAAFLFAILCLQSCAQTSYRSSNSTPSYISVKPNHHHRVSLVGVREFYLWGLIPSHHNVDISEVMSSAGLVTSAGITVEDYQTFSDKIWALMTLGLYIPKHFRLKGWGQLQGGEE